MIKPKKTISMSILQPDITISASIFNASLMQGLVYTSTPGTRSSNLAPICIHESLFSVFQSNLLGLIHAYPWSSDSSNGKPVLGPSTVGLVIDDGTLPTWVVSRTVELMAAYFRNVYFQEGNGEPTWLSEGDIDKHMENVG